LNQSRDNKVFAHHSSRFRLLMISPRISLVAVARQDATSGEGAMKLHVMKAHAIAAACFAALGLASASTEASAATRFGSLLTNTTQPANANGPCRTADPSKMCTAVMTLARNRPASFTRAPKDGTLAKIRLISCVPGSFVLQIARIAAGTQNARVVRSGPAINYTGDPQQCQGDTYKVQEFAVNVPIVKGEVLAVLATRIGFLYNAGDNGYLAYDPPLADGAAARPAFAQGAGILLLEAFYND
jgi:hypothetical protein